MLGAVVMIFVQAMERPAPPPVPVELEEVVLAAELLVLAAELLVLAAELFVLPPAPPIPPLLAALVALEELLLAAELLAPPPAPPAPPPLLVGSQAARKMREKRAVGRRMAGASCSRLASRCGFFDKSLRPWQVVTRGRSRWSAVRGRHAFQPPFFPDRGAVQRGLPPLRPTSSALKPLWELDFLAGGSGTPTPFAVESAGLVLAHWGRDAYAIDIATGAVRYRLSGPSIVDGLAATRDVVAVRYFMPDGPHTVALHDLATGVLQSEIRCEGKPNGLVAGASAFLWEEAAATGQVLVAWGINVWSHGPAIAVTSSYLVANEGATRGLHAVLRGYAL
jgi:hypothetical protein